MESRARLENVRELKSSIVSYCENTGPADACRFPGGNCALYRHRAVRRGGGRSRHDDDARGEGIWNFRMCSWWDSRKDCSPARERCLSDPEEMEEERRLCYVAITRAKQSSYHLLRSASACSTAERRRTSAVALRRRASARVASSGSTQPKPKYEQTAPRHTAASAGSPSTATSDIDFSPRPARGRSAPRRSYSVRDAGDKEESASGAVLPQGEMVQHKAFGRGMVLTRHSDGRRRAAGNRL